MTSVNGSYINPHSGGLTESLDLPLQNGKAKVNKGTPDFDMNPICHKLHHCLGPLLMSSQSVGLYFHREFPRDEYNCRKSHLSKAGQVYCTFVVLLLWANFFRTLLNFSHGDNEFRHALLTRIGFSCWHLLCALNATCFYAASFRYSAWRGFIVEWGKLHPECEGYYCLDHIRRRVIAYTVLAWFMLLLNVAFMAGLLLFTTMGEDALAGMETIPRKAAIAIAIILHLVATVAWVFPMAIFYIICVITYSEFGFYNRKFADNVDQDGRFKADLLAYRKRFNQICKVVGHADDIVSAHISASIVLNVAILCVMLYNTIWFPELMADPFVLITWLFWILTAFVQLGIIAIGGAHINGLAHASYDDAHLLSVDDLSESDYRQVQMLLNKLSASSIGVTALQMFVIDKPAILTIIGMLITYFVLLVQFKPSSANPCDGLLTNFTELISPTQ